MAAIATAAFSAAGFTVAGTYTFAAARPGDEPFAASVPTEVCRVEFGDDIVPHVPFSVRLLSQPVIDALKRVDPALANVAQQAGAEAESYTSVGRFTFRHPGGALQTDLDADAERRLAMGRIGHLFFAGSNLVEHHHLFRPIDDQRQDDWDHPKTMCYLSLFD